MGDKHEMHCGRLEIRQETIVLSKMIPDKDIYGSQKLFVVSC